MEKSDWVQRVRGVMKRTLQALDMTVPVVVPDMQFLGLCHDFAASKGYLADCGWMSPAPYLAAGAVFSQTCYAHLEKVEMRVWMAVYTAFTIALDDTYGQVPGDVVGNFIVRMTAGEPQPYANLEHFAALLRETPQHLDAVRAGLFLTSTFNWVTSLQVDTAMLGKEIPPASVRFPTWCGLMSGICEAYAMAIFPENVPFDVIAPAIPDMMVVIRNSNDVFSFYKEERLGDAANQVSLLAKRQDAPKLDVLDDIANEAISGHKSVCLALAGNFAARDAWLAYIRGFAEFHYATERYRLNELGLDS